MLSLFLIVALVPLQAFAANAEARQTATSNVNAASVEDADAIIVSEAAEKVAVSDTEASAEGLSATVSDATAKVHQT